MMSMGGLPKEIPATFNNTYTPIAAAGTETQVRYQSFYLSIYLSLKLFPQPLIIPTHL